MVRQDQFLMFLLCMAIGFMGGLLYEPFSFLRLLFGCDTKRKTLGIILDVGFFISFTVLSVIAVFLLKFPALQAFWWIGYAVGGIIYLKTLHKIIAFLEKVCYNVLVKMAKKARKKDKTLKKRRLKRI